MNILVILVGFIAVVCVCAAIWSCGHTGLNLSFPEQYTGEWPDDPDGD